MELILLSFLVSFVAKTNRSSLKMGIGMGNYFGNEFGLRPKAYVQGKVVCFLWVIAH
jgi:hypothetical protein